MLKTSQLKVLVVAVAAALCLLALYAAQPAEAAFPGKNGKITFVSNRDAGAGEIYTMKSDGTGVTRITFPTGGNSDPAFSPDGTKIAFKRSNDIYVMNANGMNSDGTGAQPITNTPVVESEPAWSPDGSKIAFVASAFEVDGSTDFEIWVMNADGTGRTLLTNNTFPDTQPAWSPDGTRIAFVSARTGETNRNVYVMNTDGAGQTSITPNSPPGCSSNCYQGHDDDPTWSPDGSKIAYVHNYGPPDNPFARGGLPNIWTMDPTGANKTNVSNSPDVSTIMPAFSPDGTQISYVGSVDTNRDIYAMNADGTGQGVLHANAANDIKPDWQQDSIPPQTTITSGPSGATNSTSASFSFVSSETGSTFECSLDGAAFTACSSPESYSGLTAGSHTLSVRATDVAGNVDSTPANRAWTVDTTAPTGTIKINSGATYTRSASVNLSLSATDPSTGSGVASMRLKNDGGSWSGWTPYATTKSWTLRKANGTRTVYVQYRDKAGNLSTAARDTIKLDMTKPTISGMSPRHKSIIRDTTPTISATVKDNMTNLAKGNIRLYVNGKPISATKYSYSRATDKLVYNSPKLSKGKKVMKIVARDAAGNVGARSWYFTIR